MRNPADLFRPAKLLTEGVRGDLPNFDRRCAAFLQRCKVELFTDNDSHPTETIQKVRVKSIVPNDLERTAIHLIGDLRSALDKATHAASILVGTSDPKHTPFPNGDSEAHFRGQLESGRGPYRGIPEALHHFFLGLRPYAGGDDVLKTFLVLSNPAKHESVLAVDINFNGVRVGPSADGSSPSIYFKRVSTVWNESKTEAEIFRTLKNRPPHGQITINSSIALNNAGKLTGKPFMRFISQVLSIADGAISGLEAETERILRARG